MSTFRRELIDLINRHSKENGSDTPDFLLADYLIESLKIFDRVVKQRDVWYFNDSNKPLTTISDGLIQETVEKIVEPILDPKYDLKPAPEELLSTENKARQLVTNESIKYRILLTYDYIDKQFITSRPFINNEETQNWVKNTFDHVLTIFNLKDYILYITCDDRNNIPEVHENNELVVDIGYSMCIGPADYETIHLTFPKKNDN